MLTDDQILKLNQAAVKASNSGRILRERLLSNIEKRNSKKNKIRK